MEAKKVELFRYNRPLLNTIREGILVKLTCFHGRVGWGEAAPLPGFSKETLADVEAELKRLAPNINRPSTLKTNSPSAEFALFSALNDLKKPLTLPPIPVNAMVFIKQLDQLTKNAFKVIKIKVGGVCIERTLELLESNRSLFENTQVRIDANQSWSLKEALFFAKKCSFLHIDYFEEPLKETKHLKTFPYPIALDESFRQEKGRFFFQAKAIIFKPTLQKWQNHFLKKGVDFIFSSSYESEIGLMQIAKLAIRSQCPLKPMGLDTHRLFKQPLFKEKLTMKEGHLFFPEKWSLIKGAASAIFRMSL